MAENKFSLFGQETPEQIRRRIAGDAEQAGLSRAALPRGRGGVALFSSLPGQLGALFDVGGEQAKAKRQQDILRQTMESASMESKAGFYRKLAENMKDENPGMALQALELANQYESTLQKENKIPPGKWTPESMEIYKETGKLSDLRREPSDPAVKIDIRDKGRTKFQEKMSEKLGERAASRYDLADSARRQNIQLDTIALALDKGATSGRGAETILDLTSFANTVLGLNINADEVGQQELIRTINSEMALRLRNPQSGLGLTGNTSNRDLAFLKAAVPGLERTPAGNKEIIKLWKKKNDYAIAERKEQDRLLRNNPEMTGNELEQALDEYAENYRMFTDKEKERITKLTEAAAPTMTDEEYNRAFEEAMKP